MKRFYGVDLGDLWRGGLTLRQLRVFIDYMPQGAAVWAHLNDIPFGWSLTDLLIADLFQAMTGEPHPARPTGREKANEQRVREKHAALMEQRARLNS